MNIEKDRLKFAIERFTNDETFTSNEKEQAKSKLFELIEEYGPIVDFYPTWHPLVARDINDNNKKILQNLDHPLYLRNAILTYPTHANHVNTIKQSIKTLNKNVSFSCIEIEELDVPFYNKNTIPLLIKCEWENPSTIMPEEISMSDAIGLWLEKEIPFWRNYPNISSWDKKRDDFIGSQTDDGVSQFISKETEEKMEQIWNMLLSTGMFK